jgi:hypothetical protein
LSTRLVPDGAWGVNESSKKIERAFAHCSVKTAP